VLLVLHRTDHRQVPELAQVPALPVSRRMDHPQEQGPVWAPLVLHRTDHRQGPEPASPVFHQMGHRVLVPEGSPASHQKDHRQGPAQEREPAQESQVSRQTDRQWVLEQELGLALPVFRRTGHRPVRELAREPVLVS
jgi:hypothetical protein